MGPSKKEIQTKLMRGLLDFVILQFLKDQPMHGYQVISSLRKSFGVYFGPSTIYPLLSLLEENGYLKSHWDLKNDRPRKVYNLTSQGKDMLNITRISLNQIYKKLENGLDNPSLNTACTQ
jgi:DNA-binding PadR family transcriptional regulator